MNKPTLYLGYTIRRGCVQGSLSVVWRIYHGKQWFGSALSPSEARTLIRGLPVVA